MGRASQRFWAFVNARVRRAAAAARQAILTDVDVTSDTRQADRAEAAAFADSAASLGAAMAKVAQLRAYLEVAGAGADPGARATLARLFDSMPPQSPVLIRRVVEEELGAPPEQLFARWNDTPIAAASLGQVHAAEDAAGRRLAVKVQYPGVAESLAHDLASPAVLRKLVGPQLGDAAAEEALEAVRDQLTAELDYRQEADHLERFRRAYAGDPAIVIPGVARDRSAGRVLTMDRLDGEPLPRAALDSEAARAQVARTIFRFAWGAPILHGLFNADPHPGNYLVLDGERVGFVDFGAVGKLAPEIRTADKQLWLAMIHREGEELRHAANLAGLVTDASVFDGEVWRLWERALAAPFLKRGPSQLEPEAAAELMRLTVQLMHGKKLRLPRASVMLWRQRLGAWSVLAGLRPTLDWRAELAKLLADDHPVPLLQRYP